MMNRVIVAVDDSRPAFAAADYAIQLALTRSVDLHFVTVEEPGRDTDGVIDHVNRIAASAGLTPTTTTRAGDQPFEVVLAVAQEWDADLIVTGRSDLRRPGQPYVGSQTEHLLEFTDIPVLVVPDLWSVGGRR
jgi:nucleotide-binding universal stress UspA family protein